ncbi:anti-sigma regulatory factor (Ser/Thr protein kinase) [Streptomyces sp. SLBN-118]|uniref:ATP-binding protein n=1 Tax=Streptomyces sp. SLBN-118 TaxID=2768454 RepID=UPI00116CB671|nr:ATP-binding protein [Streptomyces sp. SLBN-118]TQK50740.1 anti-sigma regulatory factor (Ser/Thr protein kinase) [Streptomyces sp. SLBN-118]
MSPYSARPASLGPPPLAPWVDITRPGLKTLAPRRSPKAQFTLPAQKALVGCFRDAATHVLTLWNLSDDEREAAVLVVGELAANAATHGRTEMSLCLTLDPGALCIVVSDQGEPTEPHVRGADGDPDEHGRGLGIVHALSFRVDLHHDDHGTLVVAWLAATTNQTRAD